MNPFSSKLSQVILIKKGGQKEVYSAIHADLGIVAYKLGSYSGASSLERINREVEFLKRTDSPTYPKNYGFYVDTSTCTFHILEEFIQGSALSACSQSYRAEPEIIGLVKRIVSALSLLWDGGIVHRDLKPDNLMIRPNGDLVVIDLGIARFLNLDSLTVSLGLRGPCTPLYASPEQLTNQKRAIDQRCDFFAIGIIALELFLRHHPFDPKKVGNNNSFHENILAGLYVRPTLGANCSAAFCQLANGLLSVQPYRRFKNHQVLNDFVIANWG